LSDPEGHVSNFMPFLTRYFAKYRRACQPWSL